MSLPEMPVVARDEASAAFFDAAADGVFLLRYCPACERWGPPNLRRCRGCGDSALEWRPSAGTARLVSWTVVHGRGSDGASSQPTVVGLVELSEGPWFTSRLGIGEGTELHAGTPLRVRFAHPEGGEPLPVFVPA